ncbi:MAG: hypothetical protein IPP71_17465 [Bacteroidetes bacterium]|nr:hypothetical protein [Bacteroidota bacterium]
MNIYDQLDVDLDLNSLIVTGSSHPVTSWNVDGNRMLHFSFANINLPDSGTNEPASHGFIRYKIRPLTFLTIGNTITNEAAIYFDNNLPVITNSTTNEIVVPSGINEISTTLILSYTPIQIQEISLLEQISLLLTGKL